MPGELIPIILGIGSIVMIIYIRKYMNQERMAMIEKGVPDEFPRNRSIFAIQFGLLFIGVGIGLLFGYMLDELFRMEEPGYFSMIFIFGGLGLVVSHLYAKKQEENS